MPPLILDPADVTVAGEPWQPRSPVPPDVRRFGYVPNFDEWRPGDIILVEAVRPTWTQRAISRTHERMGFSSADGRWTHAALYVGEGNICEAVISGVRHHPIYAYVGAHRLRVRRDPTLSVDSQYRVAIRALTHMRRDYSLASALRVGLTAFRSDKRPDSLLSAPGIICSQLCSRAHQSVTDRVLSTTDSPYVTPADLSLHRSLKDVPVSWRKIVDS